MFKTLVAVVAAMSLGSAALAQSDEADAPRWSIAIHGGAGTINRDKITPEQDKTIRAALANALAAGSQILKDGGKAIDAITATIMILENDPNFNAGKGAVFTWDKTNELDTSIMDGSDLSAGAAAGIRDRCLGLRLADLCAAAKARASTHCTHCQPWESSSSRHFVCAARWERGRVERDLELLQRGR